MSSIILFESKQIRRVWNEEEQKWYFSVQDVIETLTESSDIKQYVKRLKSRDPHLTPFPKLELIHINVSHCRSAMFAPFGIFSDAQKSAIPISVRDKPDNGYPGVFRALRFFSSTAESKRGLQLRNPGLSSNWGTICTLVEMPAADGKREQPIQEVIS